MRVAAIQVNSIDDRARNERVLETLIRDAASAGARLVALPEVAWWRGPKGGSAAEPVPGPATAFCARLAQELGIWIHGGTLAEADPRGGLPWNTAFLVAPSGHMVGAYRKVHLFDIDRPDLRVLESESFAPGDRAVTAKVEDWTAGLVICYDLRFPALWARVRDTGADLFICPANFTYPTGEAHWEVLLRARAIETQSWVMAPAQWGPHPHRDFRAFGHALIVDPWGRVASSCGDEGDGFALADLDRTQLESIRRSMPVAEHQRPAIYARHAARLPDGGDAP